MAWTTDQRAALATAIVSGVKTVDYGDRSVTYQSTTDMLRALAVIDAELAAGNGASSIRRSYASFRRP